jgi:predicted permease
MGLHPWGDRVRARLAALSDAPPNQDFVDEFAAHLAQVYDEARAEGATDDQARARALTLLDGARPLLEAQRARGPHLVARVDQWIRQDVPPQGRGGLMSRLGFVQDARYALRMIVRTPGFSVIAVLTFALGIGVNTAVFSVVNGVLLRPLPYPDADRITMVWLDNRRQNVREDITSYPNYLDWRDQNSAYEDLAGFTTAFFTQTGAGEPERIQGATATANFFDVMGVAPLIGRVFTAAHETPGRDAVVVLSHGLWQRRFGGAPDALGRTVTLNGTAREVIGVMPPDLQWPRGAELWVPLAPDEGRRQARNSFWLPVIGRLKPGVAVSQAQTEMSGISTRLEQTYPTLRGFGAYVVPLQEHLVGDVERPLLVLMAAVAFVLLIACANLANLMLGRTAARRRELAIRRALGAGRARIVRQIVTESLVLALVGTVLGSFLAYWATGFVIGLGGDSIPRAEAVALDARVLAFALALATLAALLSGLLPALHASGARATEHLREGGRQGGSGGSRRTRSALVAAEVALALVLLVGAGLLVRTLVSMQRVDRGFRTDGVAMGTISLPGVAYADAPAIRGFYARLLERVRALPGVESAATTTGVLMPLLANSTVFSIEGKPLPPPEERIEFPYEFVTPGYFETIGAQLVSGRTFTPQDGPEAPEVAVVNESLARLAWPDQDPVGRRLRPGGEQSQAPWITVVGVVKDMRRGEVTRQVRPEIYVSALQTTPRTQTLVVRTSGDPAALIPAVRRELQALDPQLPLFRAGTLDHAVSDTMTRSRFQTTLLGGFAAIALLLATVGIYGVTSHAVSQRRQEIGIRMALGARAADVLVLMLRQHMAPALAGIGLGVAGAIALSRSLATLLYGVSATDPATFALVALVLLAVALAACWIPARRAARVDPLVALRTE